MSGVYVTGVLFAAIFWLPITVGGFYLLLRLVRAYEVRKTAKTDIAGLEARVAHLEESLARLTSQLDQISGRTVK